MLMIEFVPPSAQIEITEHAFDRARDRLGLSKADVEFAAPHAKRVDAYKDGLRLWRIDKGWFAVHECALEGETVRDPATSTARRPDPRDRPVNVRRAVTVRRV